MMNEYLILTNTFSASTDNVSFNNINYLNFECQTNLSFLLQTSFSHKILSRVYLAIFSF